MRALLVIAPTIAGVGLGVVSAPLIQDALPGVFENMGGVLYDVLSASRTAQKTSELLAQENAHALLMPVVGTRVLDMVDTFGAPRGAGREHHGQDIFASEGTYVVSATEGVVIRTGAGDLGGNYVFVLGPGGERFYYAHLDQIDPLIREGSIVGTTTILGTVGNTGNAMNTPPHLHFGVYENGPLDSLPRLADRE